MRPQVLSIAGFDPSSGAGVSADIKTFENCHVYGLGVVSAITFQTEDEFVGLQWTNIYDIKNQLEPLLIKYPIEFVKIGLVESLEVLNSIIHLLQHYNEDIKIIWDPILGSSTGFSFHDKIDRKELKAVLKKIYLVTPNSNEAMELAQKAKPEDAANYMAQYCNVLLKGGHRPSEDNIVIDLLYSNNKTTAFESEKSSLTKHGTGCVLSATITSYLAQGFTLKSSCEAGKKYMTKFIESNDSLLGYHESN